MVLEHRYPALKYLKPAAKRRIPHFVWEYLDSATGDERTKAHNRRSLDSVHFMPAILKGEVEASTQTNFLGQSYDLPTVACQTPETIGPYVGENGWFQLYPPRDPEVRLDMINRVKSAGFKTLVLTVDIPVASRRERQTRGGITQPPVLTSRLLAQIALRPAWALGMAAFGRPEMPLVASYGKNIRGLPTTEHIGYLLRVAPDLEYVKWLRDHWEGAFIIKGVLDASDCTSLEEIGIDALWISNHAGRQFDAAPATIDVLSDFRATTSLPLIIDGGFETGLDILRAFALGADFVMMGRAWHYALAALGRAGPAHLSEMLRQDLLANMGQLGLGSVSEASKTLLS